MSIRSGFTFLAFLLLATTAFAQAPAKSTLSPEEHAALQKAVAIIESWGKDPAIVREVAAENARGMTASEIQTIDKAWMSGGEADRAAKLQSNACASHLKALISAKAGFNESFVMDNQGANVCMTDRTSDFWQGDEAKWQKSFNGGKGATFVDQPRYDVSAKAILVQVSVPVMDGGAAIGAITVGLNTKALQNK